MTHPTLRYRLPYVATTGPALGVASFLGDVTPGFLGSLLLAVFSTPATWCTAALTAGYLYRDKLRSSAAAAATLALGTITYYVLITVSGTRSGGYSLAPSTDGFSLSQVSWWEDALSVARGLVFWIFASLAAGLIIGLLGYIIYVGTPTQRSVAVGLAFGISTGPALNSIVTVARFGLNEATSQLILPAVIGIAVAMLVPAAVLMAKHLRLNGPTMVTASVTTSVMMGLLWQIVDQILNLL